MMKRFRALALAILAAALCVPARAAEKHPDGVNPAPSPHSSSAKKRNRQNPAAVALFKKAIQLSDIQSKNSTPFRLQATARIFIGNKQASGLFVEFWAPGGRSRTETMMPGYTATTVSDGKSSWSTQTLKYTPYPVSALWTSLGFTNNLLRIAEGPNGPEELVPGVALQTVSIFEGVNPPRKPRKPQMESTQFEKPKREKGGREQCVETKTSWGREAEYCFDSATGRLAEVFDKETRLRFEYSDYQPFAGKTFPYSLRIFYGTGVEMGELQVTGIVPLASPKPQTFTPTPHLREHTNVVDCGRIVAGKLTHMAPPVYPPQPKIAASAGGRSCTPSSGRTARHTLSGSFYHLHPCSPPRQSTPSAVGVTRPQSVLRPGRKSL